jgi:hypothetical protein
LSVLARQRHAALFRVPDYFLSLGREPGKLGLRVRAQAKTVQTQERIER